MKKIYIDGFSLSSNREIVGIRRYAYELLKELDRLVGKGEVYLLIPEDCNPNFKFENIKIKKVNFSIPFLNNHKWIKMNIWSLYYFHHYVRKHHGLSMDCQLMFSLMPSDIFFYYDCIVENVPQNADTIFQKIMRRFRILCTYINAKFSKIIITISNFSKNDIIKYYHVPAKKIKIIFTSWEHFNRINPDNSIIDKLGLKRNGYCFSLGSRYYHKNFRWIVEAAKQNPQYTFVVSGSTLLSSSDASLDNIKPKNMIFTGYLSDEEIKALMQNCKVFIQPSLYEGAGMPPMEAMSTGTKCIISNVTSLPELYQNSVWYIDPLKYDGINIDEIMKSEIADNSKVLERFSWNKSANRLYNIIKSIRK